MVFITCLEKTAMSSLKDSDEQTSPPATPGSRGVHVASSHFSKMSANNGKSGCLLIDDKNKKNDLGLRMRLQVSTTASNSRIYYWSKLKGKGIPFLLSMGGGEKNMKHF